MPFVTSGFPGDHIYNDGQPRPALDHLVVREFGSADGWDIEHRAFLLRGTGHPDRILLQGTRYRFWAVIDSGNGPVEALYAAEPGSILRLTLLSGQGYLVDDHGRRYPTPCHFFAPAARFTRLPVALCGWTPSDPSFSVREYTSADYAPSKGDCRDCQVVLGEARPRRR
jgi:hypothetical protein